MIVENEEINSNLICWYQYILCKLLKDKMVRFEEIKRGECFMDQYGIYMKMEPTGEEGKEYNAVDLRDASVFNFEPKESFVKLNAKIIIE